MDDDHSKANDQLKQIATSKGVNLPTALERSTQRELDKLSKMSGAEFDREYMKHMVSDHKKDVSDSNRKRIARRIPTSSSLRRPRCRRCSNTSISPNRPKRRHATKRVAPNHTQAATNAATSRTAGMTKGR